MDYQAVIPEFVVSDLESHATSATCWDFLSNTGVQRRNSLPLA